MPGLLTAAEELSGQHSEAETRAQQQPNNQVDLGLNQKRRQRVRLPLSKEEESHLDLISNQPHRRHPLLGLDAEAAASSLKRNKKKQNQLKKLRIQNQLYLSRENRKRWKNRVVKRVRL